MGRQKTGRNAPCPCGSKKKYKNCCLSKSNSTNRPTNVPLDQEVDAAANLSLNNNEQDILNSIEELKKLMTSPNLSLTQKQNIQLQLAQAFQRRGEHSAALETLKLIEIDAQQQQNQLVTLIKFCAAISYCALGHFQASCNIFDEILSKLVSLEIEPRLRASIFLEAGKAFFSNRNYDRAQECWEEAISFLDNSGREDELEQYIRTKANIGFILLKNPDETKQKEGVKIVE